MRGRFNDASPYVETFVIYRDILGTFVIDLA